MKFNTKNFAGLLLLPLMGHSFADTVTQVREIYDDPEWDKVIYTATATDEPGYTSRSVTKTASSFQELTPQQQADFARIMTQKISEMMQNRLTPEEFAKINGLPFNETEARKQTDEAAAFLDSPANQEMTAHNLGLTMKMPPQLQDRSDRLLRQMEQYNRAVQQQFDRMLAE